MIKKLFAFLVTCSILLSFSACGTSKKDKDEGISPLPSAPQVEDLDSPQIETSQESSEIIEKEEMKSKINDVTFDFDKLSKENIQWGVGVQKNEETNRPLTPDDLQEKYGKYGAYFISEDKETKEMFLTFDEGYENGYTEKILDVLKEKEAKAVFFITMPYAKSNPELIKRMVDEGHILGNHSVNHLDFTTLDYDTIKSEILDLHDYIKSNYDYEMWLLRPPTGTFSETTIAAAHDCGYISVFWSFAYRDWLVDEQPARDFALEKVKTSLHPGGIYLLHAVSKTNTEILGEFIDYTRAEGYSISEFDLKDPAHE